MIVRNNHSHVPKGHHLLNTVKKAQWAFDSIAENIAAKGSALLKKQRVRSVPKGRDINCTVCRQSLSTNKLILLMKNSY